VSPGPADVHLMLYQMYHALVCFMAVSLHLAHQVLHVNTNCLKHSVRTVTAVSSWRCHQCSCWANCIYLFRMYSLYVWQLKCEFQCLTL